MEIEYRDKSAYFVDVMGDKVKLEVKPEEIDLSVYCDNEWAFAVLDAPRVDALIALLQRWRATGELRPDA